MTQTIHPTAIIDDGATIGENVSIGPYSIVGSNVTLGNNVKLHAHVVVAGHTSVGSGTEIFPFAAIGTAPQDRKYSGEPSRLIIGENNKIREHVTMHPGTQSDAMETRIGDNGLFMVGVHVAHDCVIGNNVIMANNATLGGHVHVGQYSVIGGLAAVHQFIRIGEYAMIGGMSGVESDVIPFGRVKGERASLAGLNLVGIDRQNYSKEDTRNLQKAFKTLFYGDGTFNERLERVEAAFPDNDNVKAIVEFSRNKDRFPICQPSTK